MITSRMRGIDTETEKVERRVNVLRELVLAEQRRFLHGWSRVRFDEWSRVPRNGSRWQT